MKHEHSVLFVVYQSYRIIRKVVKSFKQLQVPDDDAIISGTNK